MFSEPTAPAIAANISETAWYDFFSSVYQLPLIPSLATIEPNASEVCETNQSTLHLNLQEVSNALLQSKAGKAPGPDGVPLDIFKESPRLWAPLLTIVFNATLKAGLPATWPLSVIVPIFKKGDRASVTCY